MNSSSLDYVNGMKNAWIERRALHRHRMKYIGRVMKYELLERDTTAGMCSLDLSRVFKRMSSRSHPIRDL